MININRFVNRVSALDAKPGRDLVLPSTEARALRDEIVKLLIDKIDAPRENQYTTSKDLVIISGGKFK